MKLIFCTLLLFIFSSHSWALSQCDSAAQDAARQFVMKELRGSGYNIEFPGPAVTAFRILRADEEYIVSVDGPRTAKVYVRTAQKSYYCDIKASQKLP